MFDLAGTVMARSDEASGKVKFVGHIALREEEGNQAPTNGPFSPIPSTFNARLHSRMFSDHRH